MKGLSTLTTVLSFSTYSFVIRELKKRNVAAAGVIYPATSLTAARIRFNVSASHTVEDIDKVGITFILYFSICILIFPDF